MEQKSKTGKMMSKKKNDSIYIGNGNKIKNSVIGNNIRVSKDQDKEQWYQKLTWKLIVPIIVAVVGATVCFWLGIK